MNMSASALRKSPSLKKFCRLLQATAILLPFVFCFVLHQSLSSPPLDCWEWWGSPLGLGFGACFKPEKTCSISIPGSTPSACFNDLLWCWLNDVHILGGFRFFFFFGVFILLFSYTFIFHAYKKESVKRNRKMGWKRESEEGREQ